MKYVINELVNEWIVFFQKVNGIDTIATFFNNPPPYGLSFNRAEISFENQKEIVDSDRINQESILIKKIIDKKITKSEISIGNLILYFSTDSSLIFFSDDDVEGWELILKNKRIVSMPGGEIAVFEG